MENNLNTPNENQFPVEVFPEQFRNLITELNNTLNFPTDYSSVGILTAISTLIGTSAKVKVKNKWFEYPSLYVCLIGNAGANKTHPINLLNDFYLNKDHTELKKYTELLKDYEEYQNLNKKEKDQTPSVAKPPLIKTVLRDFTTEVLNQRLNDNIKGCIVISDELTGFLEGMNNYSKSDQTSNFLSIYNNQPISIDRASNPKPVFIRTPFLSIIGGLQPRVIKRVFPSDKINNGLLQRFLFAFPTSTRKEAINDNELSSELVEQYNNFLNDYLEKNPVTLDEKGHVNSKIYYWSDEAKVFWHEWQKNNCDLVNENANSVKGEIASKFDNHFIRLALILQVMENSNTHEISIKAVTGASKLCKYFLNCSFRVLDIALNAKNNVEVLATNKKEFYKSLPNNFTTETAISKGLTYNLSERTLKDFLNDSNLFERVSHGNYKKLII